MSLSPEEQRAWADVEAGVARDMTIEDASYAYALRKAKWDERVERFRHVRLLAWEVAQMGVIFTGSLLVLTLVVFAVTRL